MAFVPTIKTDVKLPVDLSLCNQVAPESAEYHNPSLLKDPAMAFVPTIKTDINSSFTICEGMIDSINIGVVILYIYY
jgi:hypothetical protein